MRNMGIHEDEVRDFRVRDVAEPSFEVNRTMMNHRRDASIYGWILYLHVREPEECASAGSKTRMQFSLWSWRVLIFE